MSNETGSVSSAQELAVEVAEEKRSNGEAEDKESPSRKIVKGEKDLEATDLATVFEQRALKMLDYLLDREQLNPEQLVAHSLRKHEFSWKQKLWQTSLNVAKTVKVDVCKKKDDMNILNYVHIKKLHVAEENRSIKVCVQII